MMKLVNNKKEIVIRLDGKSMSKYFSDDKKIFNDYFYKGMKYTIEQVTKEFRFIKFVYSFKDEISLLIDVNTVKNDKVFSRYEKLISLLSGYISAVFTNYINTNLNNKKIFYFDSRLIYLYSNKVIDYFNSRQDLSNRAFTDRIVSYFKTNNIFDVEKLISFLKTKDILFDNIKEYFYGYIRYNLDKWTTVSDEIDKYL